MLTTDEIRLFLDEDEASVLKKKAREGQRYYEGQHDILEYRLFYFNSDGQLVEDKNRTNTKIPHPFFTELVDQAVQHVLSGDDGIFRADDPKLQGFLDLYFNDNETFAAELAETITGQQAKGFDYMYAYKDENDRLAFENADCLGVVEVEGRFAEDGKDQRIYKYVDRIDKEGHTQWKILVIDDEQTAYFKQTDKGEIQTDTDIKPNPKPHNMYIDEKTGKLVTKTTENSFLPMFRLDNNKKRFSHLKSVKLLIDDYDIMASSLSNNLIDFDTPLHVVKGYNGDNLDELQQNLKTKKIVGVDPEGGIEVHTVDVPYQARQAKLELDEKSIYKFGFGLNMAGLKDTAATTNIAIKMAYSLLELRCSKIITELKKFLRQLLKPVVAEINEQNSTDYQVSDVYFCFEPEVMANATENAQNKLTEAQEQQTRINTLLMLAAYLDNETLMQNICEVLDIDYEEIKGKLPDPDEAKNQLGGAKNILEGGDPTDPEPDDPMGGIDE